MAPVVWAENVSAKAINKAADDLEALGYKTKAIRLSAADMGADHIRPRYWLLAYTNDGRELLRAKYAEVGVLPDVYSSFWATNPGESRMADGVADRVDRLAATGNGQVAVVAANAFLQLSREILRD